MADESGDIRALQTCARFAGEVLVPGGSNLANGNLMLGGLYAGAGFLAKALFGFPGLLLVSAASFVKASTGQHVYEHLRVATPEEPETVETVEPEDAESSDENHPAASKAAAHKGSRTHSKKK